MPASIGTSALDVDHGDPRELLAHHRAWAVLPSRRPGGRHLYYRDDRPRGNRSWDEYGCRGQIRSGKGYLVLWDDGAERLAEEIEAGDDSRRFPADLFEAVGVTLPTLYAPRERGPAITPARAVVVPMLEVVREGGRNVALFDTVRFWAYMQDRGDDLDRWADRVREHASRHNDRFPVPLPADEVRHLAWNVASWTWAGGGPFDHSSEAQRRAQRYWALAMRRKNADRDLAFLQEHHDGYSQRAIARRHGVSRRCVRNVLDRDAPILSADGRRVVSRAPRSGHGRPSDNRHG